MARSTVIADTGFWLALANPRDRAHARAKESLQKVAGLVTTWPVAAETCHLLLNRLGTHAQLAFMHGLRAGASDIFELRVTHCARLEQLMRKYRDLPMDLADASLVLLAEELGSGDILSTDERDFRTYKWKNNKPFKNLLL